MTVAYDFGAHEAVDRTYLIQEMFAYVSEHSAVTEVPELKALAIEIENLLYKLYNNISNHYDPVDNEATGS